MSNSPKFRVKRRLQRLRRLNRIARRSGAPSDRAVYDEAVYRSARASARSPEVQQYAATLGIGLVTDVVAFIDALYRQSSGDPRQRIWEHVSALQYAATRGRRSADVLSYIRSKGGLKNCASRMARKRAKLS